MNKLANNQKGYIALIAVLIVVVATLAISLSLNLLSIGETQSGLLKQQSAQSFELADSCLEEALLKLKSDDAYTGGSLNIEQGSCTITVVSQGQNRIVTAESDVNNIKKKLEARVRVSGNTIVFDYWQELY